MDESDDVNESDWKPMDAWQGLLFLGLGIGFLSLFISLVRDDDPMSWIVIAVGGYGWLTSPLLILIGGNALYQSIKSLIR